MLFGFAKALLLPDDDDDDDDVVVVVVVVVAGRCYSCRFFAEAKRIFVPVREVAVGIVMCSEKARTRLLIFFRRLVYAQLLCFVGNGFEFCLIVVGHQTKRHDHFFAVF